jgi:hypothetical protein
LLAFADFVGLGDGWVERLVGLLAEFGGGGHVWLLVLRASRFGVVFS